MKDIIILSGGLDSTTLLYDLVSKGVELFALTFRYGQKHDKEVNFAEYHTKNIDISHKVLDISFLQELTYNTCALTSKKLSIPHVSEILGDAQPPTYVPNRNMILLSIACSLCEDIGGNSIFYGSQKTDTHSGYWDTTTQFLEAMNIVLSNNRKHNITIQAPYVNLGKFDIIKKGLALGIDYSKTWTCYKGKELACGKCVTCADRLMNFAKARLEDPLKYSIDIDWQDLFNRFGI